MSITTFDLATSLGVLQVGRDPSGQTHTSPSGVTARPADVADGVPLLDSVVALVAIDVREDVAFRTARLTIPTLTIGDTFTLTLNSTEVATYDSTGDADEDEVMLGLAAAINADADTNVLVLATAVDNTLTPPAPNAGSNNEVVLTGLAAADYSVDFTDSGTSVEQVIADASQCTAYVYAQRAAAPDTTPNTRWRKTQGSYTVDQDGYVERWNVAGISRLYVRLGSIQGPGSDGSIVTLRDPDVDIAPCILEG